MDRVIERLEYCMQGEPETASDDLPIARSIIADL
jgi:hypothetical protein